MSKKIKYIVLSCILLFAAVIGVCAYLWNINVYSLELSIPNEPVTLEYGIDSLPDVTALYKGTIFNKQGRPIEVIQTGTVDLTKLGTYVISYDAQYKGIPFHEERTFIVADTQAPIIELVSDPEHFTSPVAQYEEEGFTAIDNYDGDLTKQVSRTEKDGIVTYIVTDSSGNEARAERVIIYKDVVPPTITLKEGKEIKFTIGKEFKDPGFSASDDVDGDLTKSVAVTGSVNGNQSGTYILKYSVKDSSDNTFETERKVMVGDYESPKIKLNGKTSSYIKVGSGYSEPGYSASDNVDGDLTSKVKISGSVNTDKMGRYTITYTVQDAAGNTAKATRSIYVYKTQAVANTVNPGDKVVYLTFDDGPGKYTARLLEILDKYNVKATFFVTNQFPQYQYMIGEAHRRGHTIALHTYSHNYSKIYSSENAYYEDLSQIHNVVVAQTGTTPTIVRFPGGTNNNVSKQYCKGLMTILAETLSYHGYLYSDWNVDSRDAGGASTAEAVANNVIAGIQKRSVSNVLQHDIKSYSVEAVDKIIFWGLEHGYTFLPMTTESPMPHFSPSN